VARAASYKKIKESILGKRYDLSLAMISPAAMQRAMKYKYKQMTPANMRAVTRKTKKKNHISNVLAFPLSPASGEILICKSAAKPYTVEYLFIHGCLHLKGRKHGATMEREERRLLKKFGLRAHE
jgi:ssRNA-specific RNase YbeY (16S rRNA maturation enzyme)